jgi:hypothetical protein
VSQEIFPIWCPYNFLLRRHIFMRFALLESPLYAVLFHIQGQLELLTQPLRKCQ